MLNICFNISAIEIASWRVASSMKVNLFHPIDLPVYLSDDTFERLGQIDFAVCHEVKLEGLFIGSIGRLDIRAGA